MAVVAPTGVAALNAGGVTIHSFFRFPPRIVNPEDVERVVDNRLYKALRILVVDEVSMVRADMIDAIDRFLRINGRAPVVCTLKGGKLLPSYVRALLPRLARKAGIAKRVHPHGLRHTHSVELVRERVPITVISRQLGHNSVAVTNTYVNHLQPGEVIEAMKAREWELPKAS